MPGSNGLPSVARATSSASARSRRSLPTTSSKLGLAWFADYDTNRGQEATPLFIDGVLYVSTAWSKVKAYDARTGKLLWAYDPKVPGEFAGAAAATSSIAVSPRGTARSTSRLTMAA